MTQFKQGDHVAYVNPAKGTTKFAIVTATEDEIVEGTSFKLYPNHVSLAIFSPKGTVYGKANVPTQEFYESLVAANDAASQDTVEDAMPIYDIHGNIVQPQLVQRGLPKRFVAPLGFVPQKPEVVNEDTGELDGNEDESIPDYDF